MPTSAIYSQLAPKYERKWQTKTSAYTAIADDRIFLDSSGGVFTITLPANPNAGDVIKFLDISGSLSTNNVTLGRNGQNIMGLAEDMDLDQDNAGFDLVFTDATNGWRIL